VRSSLPDIYGTIPRRRERLDDGGRGIHMS
jgi:hypothetical protein